MLWKGTVYYDKDKKVSWQLKEGKTMFSSGDQGEIRGADESRRALKGLGVECEVCGDIPVRV